MAARPGISTALVLIAGCQSAQSAGPGPAGASEPAAAEPCATELVTGQPARGVIFAPSCAPVFAHAVRDPDRDVVVGYFRPTAAQIQALEAGLRPALELGRTKPESLVRMPVAADDRAEWSWGVQGAITKILEQFTEYRRQYAGIVARGGARRVFVSSFPEIEADGRDDFPDWTVRWVDVDDGDHSFWRIEYDVDSGQFSGFDSNPSA